MTHRIGNTQVGLRYDGSN